MAEQKKKMKRCPVSMQPDIENLLNDLSPEDFSKASKEEKDDFIQDRKSVSYWKDAWRRLKKNVVAMVALGVIVLLFLFAFLGPVLVPYGYDEFNKGAENLYPYHYTLEDQQKLDAEIASRTKTDVVDVDEMIAKAKEEAEAKGEEFTKKDEAVIRAQARTHSVRSLASKSMCVVIPKKNWNVRLPEKKFFHMYLELTCMAVTFWYVLCTEPEYPCP